MELDDIKQAWRDVPGKGRDLSQLEGMLRQKSYPVLSASRRQLIVESLGFAVFLFCYYSMFDGMERPLWANGILICSLLLQLFYGYRGYVLQARARSGRNLLTDLLDFGIRLRAYRREMVVARGCFAAGLLLFFCYGLDVSGARAWALGLILAGFVVQLLLLYRAWSKRIARLDRTLQGFTVGQG